MELFEAILPRRLLRRVGGAGDGAAYSDRGQQLCKLLSREQEAGKSSEETRPETCQTEGRLRGARTLQLLP